ncbi:MAG: hypothetical protein M1820_005401 [Bogoriella megaspora]|nr:MAG: hypothetical protein M1820_005401 [Bogoriella megaspora]
MPSKLLLPFLTFLSITYAQSLTTQILLPAALSSNNSNFSSPGIASASIISFDGTSTTIALTYPGFEASLPADALGNIPSTSAQISGSTITITQGPQTATPISLVATYPTTGSTTGDGFSLEGQGMATARCEFVQSTSATCSYTESWTMSAGGEFPVSTSTGADETATVMSSVGLPSGSVVTMGTEGIAMQQVVITAGLEKLPKSGAGSLRVKMGASGMALLVLLGFFLVA